MEKEKLIKIFASNLRAERARKQYSQESLAEKAEITPEYLNRLENEKCTPSLFVVAKLAVALKIDLNILLPLKDL